MKFKVSIIFLFIVFSLLPGISLAQNKVVVIPLMSDCSDEILTVTSAGGRVWMDRNLGAFRVAQSVDDYHAYGYLYQWGRLADGHEARASDTITTLSGDDDPGHDDFITSDEDPNDWRDPQHHSLWSPLLGLNNPCPDGFRVPTETEWQTEIDSWSTQDAAGAFASPLKLVISGYRYRLNGTVDLTGKYGYYWSSNINGSNARGMYVNIGSSGMYSYNRANGFSVRCIKD